MKANNYDDIRAGKGPTPLYDSPNYLLGRRNFLLALSSSALALASGSILAGCGGGGGGGNSSSSSTGTSFALPSIGAGTTTIDTSMATVGANNGQTVTKLLSYTDTNGNNAVY